MTHNLRSTYIVGAGGSGVFRNRFNYSTGRWVTIRGLRQKPQPGDIRAELVRSGFDGAPAFASSNALLNDIHATTLWTLENLMLGGYIVDCAQRERMGYSGDAHATTTTALYHYPLGAFFTKWAQDWRDVQGNSASWGVGRQAGQLGAGGSTDDGNLPYTAPTYWGGGGPAWSGYSVHLPWEMYQFYGDKRLLAESLPTIRRWLAACELAARTALVAAMAPWSGPAPPGPSRRRLVAGDSLRHGLLAMAADASSSPGSPTEIHVIFTTKAKSKNLNRIRWIPRIVDVG